MLDRSYLILNWPETHSTLMAMVVDVPTTSSDISNELSKNTEIDTICNSINHLNHLDNAAECLMRKREIQMDWSIRKSTIAYKRVNRDRRQIDDARR